MKGNKLVDVAHESHAIFDRSGYSEREFSGSSEEEVHIHSFFNRQEKLKNDIAFWNSMADGKLETIAGITNLFILLMIITLASTTYNGLGTNGANVLGWISVSQACFFYLLIAFIKFKLVPSLEKDLQQSSTAGFQLYNNIESGKTHLTELELSQLEMLEEVITLRVDSFKKCFPKALPDTVLNEVRFVIGSRSSQPYTINTQIKNIKLKEANAKWWQAFWQIFILGKTFSLPGVLLLVFIITPLQNASAAQTSLAMNNAQGWLAVGFWAAGITVFLIIKVFLWDALNEEVENTKSDSFVAFYPVSLKHKSLKQLSLSQLQDLNTIFIKRRKQFQTCFPEVNSSEVLSEVEQLLKQRLPNKKGEEVELNIKEIINNEKALQSYSAAWLSFFNQRLISTIINSLKFLIVMAITFIINYPQTTTDTQNVQVAVGSIGIGIFAFGYFFYFLLRAYYLENLEEKAFQGRSSPFTTFRLVYFGNKSLTDLEVHELEEVNQGVRHRSDQFERIFPTVNSVSLHREIEAVIRQKILHYQNIDKVHDLLKKQTRARKMLTFWTNYIDNPFLTSMYSVYVLLVLIIVTITSEKKHATQIVGWIGVANLGLLLLIVLFFKTYLIQYLTESVKALRVEGFSEFNLVYTKAKLLKALQISELEKILKIIETNPIEFRRCFPKAKLLQTLNQVKDMILQKQTQKSHMQIRAASEQALYQQLALELSRCKNALTLWGSFIKDKLLVWIPIAIVIFILWAQTIATTLDGITVCGFFTVAELSLTALLIAFYNLYYHSYLEKKKEGCQRQLKFLEGQPIHHKSIVKTTI